MPLNVIRHRSKIFWNIFLSRIKNVFSSNIFSGQVLNPYNIIASRFFIRLDSDREPNNTQPNSFHIFGRTVKNS